MNAGNNIQNVRKESGMSQDEFAKLFHVTRQTVSNWENSKSYPDLETLVKISNKFSVPLDVLMKEDFKMIREIDAQRKKSKRWRNTVIVLAVILLVLIVFAIIFLKSFAPVSTNERNYSTSNTTMFLDIADDERRAIVQSYTSEEFENMSLNEKNALRGIIEGNIEGDIPCVRLSRNPIIRPVLQSSDKTGKAADKAPEYRLVCYANTVMLPESDEEYENLIERDESARKECWTSTFASDSQGYFIDISKLSDIQKLKTDDEELLCTCYLEIRYSIYGKEYISITAFSLVE